MQPVVINAVDVSQWVGRLWWPSLRIGGFVAVAPIASERSIPNRVKIVLTLSLAVLVGPLAPVPPSLSIFSGAGILTAVQEILIGVSIGTVMELAFEALTFAGQTISMTMGLGFATLVDPQRGANVPVLGQLFMIMGTLTYLAINGHLVLLGALANSFRTLPIGAANIDQNFLIAVATWGTRGALAFAPTGGRARIGFVMGDYNGLNGGATPESSYALLGQLAQLVRGAGGRLVCGIDPLRRASPALNAAETRFNALVRLDPDRRCDATIDFQAEPIFARPDGPYDRPYFSSADGVHMTDAGQAAMARIAAPVFARLLQ